MKLGPTPVRLSRPRRAAARIPLTPLVDVLLILLVFFMATSTFLDLDMLPLGGRADPPAAAQDEADAASGDGPAGLLVRIGADDALWLGGRPRSPESLGAAIAEALVDRPGARIVVLPSPAASAQALAHVVGAAAEAGVEALRVVRFSELEP